MAADQVVVHIIGRRWKALFAASVIVMLLTCYFCWEILYQERVILEILKMSKLKGVGHIKPDSDHLEEIVDDFFEDQKREMIVSVWSRTTGRRIDFFNSTLWPAATNLTRVV